MMCNRRKRIAAVLGFVLVTASSAGAQHRWPPRSTGPADASQVRPITAPTAVITGSSNGVFCPDMTEGAVGVHDLGWLPSGVEVTATVVSQGPATFDPMATVTVAGLSGGSAAVKTFADNDSGGDRDPRIVFVTPQQGTFLLLVGDNSGSGAGCYRYQVSIR